MMPTTDITKGIMIVDHELGRLRLIASYLRQAGFVPLSVQNADQALEALEMLAPDLFIINADIACTSGLELCSKIRALPHAENAPMLIMKLAGTCPAGNPPHVDDVVTIPFVSYELIQKVQRLLND